MEGLFRILAVLHRKLVACFCIVAGSWLHSMRAEHRTIGILMRARLNLKQYIGK